MLRGEKRGGEEGGDENGQKREVKGKERKRRGERTMCEKLRKLKKKITIIIWRAVEEKPKENTS